MRKATYFDLRLHGAMSWITLVFAALAIYLLAGCNPGNSVSAVPATRGDVPGVRGGPAQ